MPKEAYIYRTVLIFLKENPGFHTAKEIVEGTHASYSAVSRVLPKLSKERRIKKRSGPAHSYLYEFNQMTAEKEEITLAENKIDPLAADDLRAQILTWCKTGWTPRANQAAEQLLVILGHLHQFYWMSLERGLPVDQKDLDHLKSKLIVIVETVHKFTEFFDRLLATEDLWNARRSAEYLLAGLSGDDGAALDYVEQARSVTESVRVNQD